MDRRKIKFGVIGCGLMGREFASAAARWCHLLDQDITPEIVAVSDVNPAAMAWFRDHVPSVTVTLTDYRDLLSSPGIEAIYCAVPHNLHEQIYVDVVKSGKHLLAEKPFGIDIAANRAIVDAIRESPTVLARCSSEFPFYPGAQRILQLVQTGQIGEVIGVEAGFLHSSDLDPLKPINWKRRNSTNGHYGCMGDLGMHVLHIPLRLGWKPLNVRALLSNIVTERPGASGIMEPCDTWDNAILACDASDGGKPFPMVLETKRIAPGETNSWYLRVYGTSVSAEFSTKYPKTLRTMTFVPGGAQAWLSEDLGPRSAYPSITGHIFEFGFSDSILQMWAAFCDELAHGNAMQQPFICVTPEETMLSHELFTAALESQKTAQVVEIGGQGLSTKAG